jgi:hypothetical protein
MLLLWWCPFKNQYKKLPGLQVNSTERLSPLSTPFRIRWTVPLSNVKSAARQKFEENPADSPYRNTDQLVQTSLIHSVNVLRQVSKKTGEEHTYSVQ